MVIKETEERQKKNSGIEEEKGLEEEWREERREKGDWKGC